MVLEFKRENLQWAVEHNRVCTRHFSLLLHLLSRQFSGQRVCEVIRSESHYVGTELWKHFECEEKLGKKKKSRNP